MNVVNLSVQHILSDCDAPQNLKQNFSPFHSVMTAQPAVDELVHMVETDKFGEAEWGEP